MTKRAPTIADKYSMRLYVAGSTPQSITALRNLKKLCELHLPGQYKIEIVDLRKNPERAKDDEVIVVPTLVRKLPTPIRKFIGNLSNPERVLVDFNLGISPAAPFTSKEKRTRDV